MQSAHKKDWSWANICPIAAFGADCLTDQAGVVDDMLLNPINLGNVLDYGADPSGDIHDFTQFKLLGSACSIQSTCDNTA